MNQPQNFRNNQGFDQQYIEGSRPATATGAPGYPYGGIVNSNGGHIGGSRVTGSVITNGYGPAGVRVVNGGPIGSQVYPNSQSIMNRSSAIRQ